MTVIELKELLKDLYSKPTFPSHIAPSFNRLITSMGEQKNVLLQNTRTLLQTLAYNREPSRDIAWILT